METREVIIRLENVGMTYDRRPVLEDASLNIYRGDFLAVSGPNGGGKTTFLRILLKLLKPTLGKVTYYDASRPVGRLAIGYLPQKSNIDTHFPISVAEVVKSGGLSRVRGMGSERIPADFHEIVERTGIGSYLDRQIGDLSGGQLQRVLLGRALMTSPSVLVLDEPLSYVDKRFEHQIYDLMAELSQRTTIILVSHEMSVISGMANRHIIIDHRLHECHAGHHYRPAECDEEELES